MFNGMKDKLWAYVYKKIMTYRLFKLMRAHKYSDYKKVKKETIDKWKV